MSQTTSKPEAAGMPPDKRSARSVGALAWLCALSGFVGGVLWALSPLGVRLSAEVLRAPELFWRLFPSAPLAMFFGLVGMLLFSDGEGAGIRRTGFALAVLGALLVVFGNVALYHLKLDDLFIRSAPFYRTFRVGLFVFAAGTLFFACVLARQRSLPPVATLPLVPGAFFGTVSVFRNLESLGAGLWILFGVAFAWCSLALVVLGFVRFFGLWKKKRAARVGADLPGSQRRGPSI